MIINLSRNGSLSLWLIGGFFLGPVGHVSAYQATSQRLVKCNDPAQITDPVLMSNVAVSGQTVQCGLFVKPPSVVQSVTPFQSTSDWLQKMTIAMVNRTNKTIVAGTVTLLFLDNASDCRTEVCPMEQMRVGQLPAVDAYDGRTGQPLKPEDVGIAPVEWKAEQTFTLHVSDYWQDIETKLSNFGVSTEPSKVAIHLGPFYFADGMKWGAGAYATPVLENPGKFKYLPGNYFPGRRGHNWPPGFSQ